MAYYNGKKLGYPGKQKGGYTSGGHTGGPGRGQNLSWPAAGEDYNKPLPKTKEAVVGDGPNGRGYQKDAHSGSYHNHGEAVGHLTDNKPMHYSNKLHGEGNSEIHTDGQYGKAAHHPSMTSDAHRFPNNKSGHGFRHSPAQMKGPLRMSGNPRAHRIGCK